MDPFAINERLLTHMSERLSKGAGKEHLGQYPEIMACVDTLTALQLNRQELGDDEEWFDTFDSILTLHTDTVVAQRRQHYLDSMGQKCGVRYYEDLYVNVIAERDIVTVVFHKIRALPKMLVFVHDPTQDEMLQCAQEVYATTFGRSLVRQRLPNQSNSPVPAVLRWYKGKFGRTYEDSVVQMYSVRRL